jgi:BlaI family penicillinase repressor
MSPAAKAKKSPRPLLTRAESEIMRVLWQRGAATVHEVSDTIERPLAYTTVLTMLRTLEQKGHVARERSPDDGRAHVYKAVINEEGARRSHLRDLVERLFGGQRDELMIGLLRDERWTRAELEQMRAEIDAKLSAEHDGNKKKGGRG